VAQNDNATEPWQDLGEETRRAAAGGDHCPDRKPPFLAVKRPACPYKSKRHTNTIYYGKR
jgi:hypothetical protein